MTKKLIAILLAVIVLFILLLVWVVWSNGAAKLSNITITSGNLPKKHCNEAPRRQLPQDFQWNG